MKGWECPKCGNVFAPCVNECLNCKKMQQSDNRVVLNYTPRKPTLLEQTSKILGKIIYPFG